MKSTGDKSKPLIIGIGNEFRGDDAFGIVAATEIHTTHPDLFDVILEQGDTSRLIDQWQNRDVIVLDAVYSPSKAEGEIHLAHSFEELKTEYEKQFSTHGISLEEAIKLSILFGREPASFLFIGVEGGQWELGAALSEKVRSMISEVEKVVMEYEGGLNQKNL